MSASVSYCLLTEENRQRVNELIEWLVKKQVSEEKKVSRTFLTDDQVEAEIARLKSSEYVKLAKAEERIRLKRRQYMYTLRNLEKKGKALEAAGLSLDMLGDEE